MSDQERKICDRVRIVREATGWSQKSFAIALHIGRDKLASIEYGRTPLRSELALDLAKLTGCNLRWLAEGQGPIKGPLPSLDLVNMVPARSLFSSAWKTWLCASKDSAGNLFGYDAPLRQPPVGASASEYLSEDMAGFFRLVPPQLHDNFYAHITRAGKEFVEMNLAMITDWNAAGRKQPKEHLTKTATLSSVADVKDKWPVLKQKLQKATSVPGTKSKLAKFLGVDLTRISQWLSDAKNAREPGAEYALRMLYWVEHPEVQK